MTGTVGAIGAIARRPKWFHVLCHGITVRSETRRRRTQPPVRATAQAPKRAANSAHSLRAGFVTPAHLRGATDRAIAHQTRHRSLATLSGYVRIHTAWDDNAATQLGH
jgi:hypothetical protein